jgi:hypothetical protein
MRKKEHQLLGQELAWALAHRKRPRVVEEPTRSSPYLQTGSPNSPNSPNHFVPNLGTMVYYSLEGSAALQQLISFSGGSGRDEADDYPGSDYGNDYSGVVGNVLTR